MESCEMWEEDNSDYLNGFNTTSKCVKCENKFDIDFTINGSKGYNFNLEMKCESCGNISKVFINLVEVDQNGNKIVTSCNECDESKGGECGSSDGCCGCTCHKKKKESNFIINKDY